jgi:hypothetical protein
MAWFPDLSPHTYTPTCSVSVVNVGWLDEGNDFAVGSTSSEFQAALQELCRQPVYLHRGTHACWFCRRLHRLVEGNGQIRILGKGGVWFAAPTLIFHYVTVHEYLPPAEFIEAVLCAAKVEAKMAFHDFEGPKPKQIHF